MSPQDFRSQSTWAALCPSGTAASPLCKERSRYPVKAPRGFSGPWWLHTLLHSCSGREQGKGLARALSCHVLDKTEGTMGLCQANNQIPARAGTNLPVFEEKYWVHQDYQLNMFQWYNTSANRKREPTQHFLPAGGCFQNDHLWEGDLLSYLTPAVGVKSEGGFVVVVVVVWVFCFCFSIYVPAQDKTGRAMNGSVLLPCWCWLLGAVWVNCIWEALTKGTKARGYLL